MRWIKKKNTDKLSRLEKDIRINLANKKNIISEKSNPLFYNIQPFMVYKNKYVLDKIKYLYECYNEDVDNIILYFEDYVKLYKKYDFNSIVKKVEVLTNSKFMSVYESMVSKMIKTKTR